MGRRRGTKRTASTSRVTPRQTRARTRELSVNSDGASTSNASYSVGASTSNASGHQRQDTGNGSMQYNNTPASTSQGSNRSTQSNVVRNRQPSVVRNSQSSAGSSGQSNTVDNGQSNVGQVDQAQNRPTMNSGGDHGPLMDNASRGPANQLVDGGASTGNATSGTSNVANQALSGRSRSEAGNHGNVSVGSMNSACGTLAMNNVGVQNGTSGANMSVSGGAVGLPGNGVVTMNGVPGAVVSGGEHTVGNMNVLLQNPNNTGLLALTSVCSPVGANVPQTLKEKIIKGEYIELGQLLETSMPKKVSNFTLNMNNEGQIVWEDCRPKRRITSIHAWTTAFIIFSGVFLEAHPHRTQELLKYMSLIRTAAARYQGYGWREYDRQWRLRQASQPLRSWAAIDSELWSLYAASGLPVQYTRQNIRGVSHPNTTAFSTTSFRGPGPVRSQNTKMLPGQQGRTNRNTFNQVCFAFNAAGCGRNPCKFQHSCTKCRGADHGAATCKKSS